MENPTNYLCELVFEIIFHFAWPFLDPMSITLLCIAAPVISCYRKLHTKARSIISAEIHRILTPPNHRTSTSSICSQRAHGVYKILLLCDFRLGGMIRCLSGTHTGNFLNLASINECILDLFNIPVVPGESPRELTVLQHLFHYNPPYKYSFQSARKEVLFRNCYNNHCDSKPYLYSIHENLAINIHKSYSITLPLWTLRFVRCIFLASLG